MGRFWSGNKLKPRSIWISNCNKLQLLHQHCPIQNHSGLGHSDSGLLSQHVQSLSFGINYGQIANNLPSPSCVPVLLQSLNVSRVKLYVAHPNVLQAFSNFNVDFIISLGNEFIPKMTLPQSFGSNNTSLHTSRGALLG